MARNQLYGDQNNPSIFHNFKGKGISRVNPNAGRKGDTSFGICLHEHG